ncbi:hypothetical protein HOD08_02305, partial [bacterium]|nr:hypothetical protein [bacterium]
MRLLHFWGLFIIVGIFAGLAIVSRKDVQQCVADGILAELEADWDAKVTVDDSSVDFLTGTLGFRGCTIRPRTMPGCVCKVGSGTILVDRFSLAVLKKKHLKIFIQDVKVETGFTKSGKCEFFELLKLIMAPSDSVFLRHFSLNNAFFKFRTGVGANDFKLGGGIKIDCGRSGRFKLSSDVKNSAWAISGVTVLKNFFVRGNVARRKRQNKFLGNFNGACDLPGLGKDAHHRINLAFRNGRCAGSLLPQDSGVHVNYRSDQRSKCTRWYTDEGALTSFAKLLKRAGASLPIKIAESLVARGAVGGVGNRESLVARLAVIDNKKSRNFLSSCGEIGKNGIRFAWTLCPTRHTKLTGTIELPKDSQPKGTVALGLPVPLVSGLSCVPGKSTMASFEKLGSGAWLGKYCLGTSGYRAPRCNKCVGCFRTKPHGNSEIYCVLPHGNFRCDIS